MEKNEPNGTKNSPRQTWTEFFQKWMLANPGFTVALVFAYSAFLIFIFVRKYATDLVAFLTALAVGIVVPILLAMKGKK